MAWRRKRELNVTGMSKWAWEQDELKEHPVSTSRGWC